MYRPRSGLLLAACLVALGACSSTASSGDDTQARSTTSVAADIDDDGSAGTSTTDATEPPTTSSETTAPTTDAPDESAPVATTTTTTTTTTTPPPVLDVYDPVCVVQVASGESISLIADRIDDDTVTTATIRAENNLSDNVIHTGQLLDVCIDNGIDDVTGETKTERNSAIVQASVLDQQRKLNELFVGYGTPELLVDGISGPVTRQRLCAARVSLGLPISTNDMEPGSLEEQALMAADALEIPFTSSILSERWILIDQTCQIMFVGSGTNELTFIFPTSTGEPGHRTRDQDLTPMFRYDPALQNNGWHNSRDFPAAEDNPLNGNMYKPLYFDRGQAIHGANNVPTSPQSKGCARLRVEHQNALVNWLGLDDATGVITSRGRLNVTVNVQGDYVPV